MLRFIGTVWGRHEVSMPQPETPSRATCACSDDSGPSINKSHRHGDANNHQHRRGGEPAHRLRMTPEPRLFRHPMWGRAGTHLCGRSDSSGEPDGVAEEPRGGEPGPRDCYRHEQQRGVVRPAIGDATIAAATSSANALRSPSSRRATQHGERDERQPGEPAARDGERDGCAEPTEDAGDRVAPRRIHVLGLPKERRVVEHPVEPDDGPRADDQDDRRRGGPRGGAVALRHEQPDDERPGDQLCRDGRPDRDSHDRRPLAIAPRQCERAGAAPA